MNMHVSLPQESVSLASFRRTPQAAGFDRSRMTGMALAIVVHAAIAAALIYGGIRVAHDLAPEPIMVDVTPQTDASKPLPPPPVALVHPPSETIPMPEISIATDAPAAIHADPAPQAPSPPQTVASTAPSETQQSYLGRLLAYLNRFKRYPAEARSAHIQGVVMLHFVMDKAGRVTAFDIARSSGRPALDEEALALIQRAQPLPAIPDDFGKSEINAVVPIEFTLH
ncbi:MAG: energy transducer TonB [Proteobacteria bacterium]|nr:energy transducer TonB [Pseudomonadota bacterium]